MERAIKAAPDGDGRRRRGQDNRARIVAAMLEIIHGGELSPGAEQVAERADVGLRTVFRHFKDMDSLYSEMSEVIEAEMRGIAGQPFKTDDPRERVIELVERRAAVFEKIGPFKRASDALRHRSRFLDNDNDRLVRALRDILQREAPPEIAGDPLRFEALDLLLSWESWARLRREQGLAPDRARQVLESAVRTLLG
ncbi:TetR/AcrR family transcriptional regulator [Phenylobacterium sp.]|uniref:TetR/AcrR family transcriptional regulator n=1 Tax=Phenylobacterium sp. TaxID=1871053 RepID=UPI0028A13691|nr:TetR/AcrR family transcriptional regulator [Phenylobacterium sp.]